MGNDMTNQEAIEIVEDIGFYVNLSKRQEDALNQLIKTAKEYDVLTGIIGVCGEA